MGLVQLTALNFAKRNQRTNPQFVDECVAEANFWLVVIFEEFKDEIFNHDNQIAYIRMKVAYKLKEYFAPYATSTMSYFKSKNKSGPSFGEIDEESLAKINTDIECFECLQSILQNQLEWDVYEHFILNKSFKQIATALGIRAKRVQRILAKIRKRLKALKRDKNADLSTCC